jgi:hypothetical protein
VIDSCKAKPSAGKLFVEFFFLGSDRRKGA